MGQIPRSIERISSYLYNRLLSLLGLIPGAEGITPLPHRPFSSPLTPDFLQFLNKLHSACSEILVPVVYSPDDALHRATCLKPHG